jgi:hypothetical protein
MLPMPKSFSGPRPALAAALALAFLSPLAEAASPDAYDPAVAYRPGAVVLGNDGNAYRAAAEVKGSDPVTSADGAWRLAHVAADLVLDVPGRFESIADAWAFLEGARIAESATVAIELAPGTLEHDKPLVLNHTEGSRIVIRGAVDEPEDCVLELPGVSISGLGGLMFENITLAARQKDQGVGINVFQDGAVFVILSKRALSMDAVS